MRARKANGYLTFLSTGLVALLLLMLHALMGEILNEHAIREQAGMVRALGLTDLCLFTEARYTRHPAVADLATAFQDHPASLGHFPSGSIVEPPPHLREHGHR